MSPHVCSKFMICSLATFLSQPSFNIKYDGDNDDDDDDVDDDDDDVDGDDDDDDD